MRHLLTLFALFAFAFTPSTASAANEVKVVLDDASGDELKAALWSALPSLADHRAVIAVFVIKDVTGGPFCDEYSGIDMLTLAQDSDGGLIIEKYTSGQGGALRKQRTDPTSGNLSSERTVSNAAEDVAHGGEVTWDFKENASGAELTAARSAAGC